MSTINSVKIPGYRVGDHQNSSNQQSQDDVKRLQDNVIEQQRLVARLVVQGREFQSRLENLSGLWLAKRRVWADKNPLEDRAWQYFDRFRQLYARVELVDLMNEEKNDYEERTREQVASASAERQGR